MSAIIMIITTSTTTADLHKMTNYPPWTFFVTHSVAVIAMAAIYANDKPAGHSVT